jgi:hypothetical protein
MYSLSLSLSLSHGMKSPTTPHSSQLMNGQQADDNRQRLPGLYDEQNVHACNLHCYERLSQTKARWSNFLSSGSVLEN